MDDIGEEEMTLAEQVERYAKHCEREAFTLEALAKERRTLAADMRFAALSSEPKQEQG